jgi:hypothetical protein
MVNTLHNLLKAECAIWGEDYIYDLIDRGYEPTLVSDGDSVKLTFRLTDENVCATVSSAIFTPVWVVAD